MENSKQLQHEPTLHGRVFARRRAFLALPAEEQRQVFALAAFLDQSRVFRKKSVGFLRSIEGISSDQLGEIVLDYLDKRPQLLEHHLQHQINTAADANDNTVVARVSLVLSRWRKHVAGQLIDWLVLSGYLSIYNEEQDRVLRTKLEDFERPGLIFLPTMNKKISGGDVSVWSVRANALAAATLKRTGKLSKGSGGSDAYFVVDGKWKVLYWFDSDAATEAKDHIALDGVKVQSSGPSMSGTSGFTVKVGPRLFMVGADAEAFINPMINCGAVFDILPLMSSGRSSMVLADVKGGEKLPYK